MDPHEARLRDLLADRALGEPLDEAECREVSELCARYPNVSPLAYEYAVACVHLGWLRAAFGQRLEGLPPFVQRRILGLATRLEALPGDREPRLATMRWASLSAALVLVVLAFRSVAGPPPPPPGDGTPTVAKVSDWLTLPWTATEDPAATGVTGEVVWSPSLGQGRMRFSGLPVQDAEGLQYQLWIFDAERKAEHPVDGGVFDARAGSFDVPIDAKLPVGEATLFAITLERAGGVVVSSRERLLLTAAL